MPKPRCETHTEIREPLSRHTNYPHKTKEVSDEHKH
jgi:hypothetical protein